MCSNPNSIRRWEGGISLLGRVGLAQSVACPPLAREVVSSPLGRVIPKTIINGTNCLPA